MIVSVQNSVRRRLAVPVLLALILLGGASASRAQQAGTIQTAVQQRHEGGEASLVLPDLSTVDFHGINGRTLLMGGLVVCGLGLLFGLLTFTQLKALPVHRSMREVSE